MLRDAVHVVSIDTDVVDRGSAIERVSRAVGDGSGGYVCVSTVHMVIEANDDPAFAETVNASLMTVPDGMPLLWMQKLLGRRDAARVRGNDLMTGLLEYAETSGLSVGFYGGRPEVIEKIRERTGRELARLRLVYAYSPPFSPTTDDKEISILDEIKAASPDILFVGLGCPKQEVWMAGHRDRLNCVMLGVGAAFDFYAGNLRECPGWISRLGLEWLFRLTQEPKRLWRRYLILNPRFVMLAIFQLLRGRNSGR